MKVLVWTGFHLRTNRQWNQYTPSTSLTEIIIMCIAIPLHLNVHLLTVPSISIFRLRCCPCPILRGVQVYLLISCVKKFLQIRFIIKTFGDQQTPRSVIGLVIQMNVGKKLRTTWSLWTCLLIYAVYAHRWNPNMYKHNCCRSMNISLSWW